jgi:hypothetical protein
VTTNAQAAHHASVNAAENARQVAKAATNNAAGHKAADIIYYRAVLASARANGVKTGALAMLHQLGAADGEYGLAGDT